MVDTAVDMEVMVDVDTVDTVERDLLMPGTDRQDHPRHLPNRPPYVLRHATGRPQEACKVQVCIEDPDENPPCPCEGRGGGPHREEDHHSRPLRDPWKMHLEACLILALSVKVPIIMFKLKVLIVLPS